MTADDILTRLVAQGVGAAGVTLFKSQMPSSPDHCLRIKEVPGAEPDRCMGRVSFENPGISIVTRSTSHEAASQLAWAAWYALDGFVGTLNTVRYLWIHGVQSPWDVGIDENNRYLFSATYAVMKELTPP